MSQSNKSDEEFQFGRKNLKTGGGCCGKPVGCSMTHDGCCFLRHPWKRANVFHEEGAPCTATSYSPDRDGVVRGGPDTQKRCVLPAGHEGAHSMSLSRVELEAAR